MFRKFILLITIVSWSGITLPLPKQASAEISLNRAVVQNLRNLVRLIPQNRQARPARKLDAMTPGDALSTGRSSLAELRFNDGSMARIGEQAIFRFLTKTRNFKLSNGTVLLLIPPGRGITGVQTPNAAAAIRGSALFVRYIPDTNTTIVGALTDSNIEVFNDQASQSEVLEAGQMAVIVEDKIERLYEFDLNTFYETSDLVQELNLNQPEVTPSQAQDPAIASVQAETSEAAAAQEPIRGEGVIENPAFIQQPSVNAPGTPVTTPVEDKPNNTAPVNNSTPPDSSTPANTNPLPPINTPTPVDSPVKPSVDPPVDPPGKPPEDRGKPVEESSEPENNTSTPEQKPVVEPPDDNNVLEPPDEQQPVVEPPDEQQQPVVEPPDEQQDNVEPPDEQQDNVEPPDEQQDNQDNQDNVEPPDDQQDNQENLVEPPDDQQDNQENLVEPPDDQQDNQENLVEPPDDQQEPIDTSSNENLVEPLTTQQDSPLVEDNSINQPVEEIPVEPEPIDNNLTIEQPELQSAYWHTLQSFVRR